ncbi:MAG: flagellar hook-associated protein FlgK [Lachnospiraceae bacterium]|nr:flagellar hook-associated protein FlgK [Lachnospiraceae bacterium]
MSLFSGLYVGTTALRVASDALNTTAHNISNSDTAGYTRQQVSQSTRHYNILSSPSVSVAGKEIGMGVKYAETRQVRDFFLDQVYRRESGRSAFYEVSYEALTHVQDLLGESGDRNFAEAIEDYWKTIEELAGDPSSAVTQGLFVSKAQTLIERATNVYKSLQDYQNNLNKEVKKYADKLNDYGKRLTELNKEISKIEAGGIEHANDQRDERNYILDQMAELCSISYSEDTDGFVSVQIEGVDFVKRNVFYEMKLDKDEDTGFYTPFWPHIVESSVNEKGEIVYSPEEVKKGQVFNLEREISTAANTDVGRLKALLLVRGDHAADCSEMANTDQYNREIAPSVCMNIQAEFDKLISSIAMAVNDILGDAGYTDGTNNTDNLLFVRINREGMAPGEGWHIGNIKVNDEFLKQPALLNFVRDEDSVDYETAAKLKDAFEKEDYTLNPNTEKRSNFKDYYGDLVIQVSNTGSVNKLLYEYQLDTQEETNFAREQILGVSTDEELQFMIKFQNAYNVASRYITTLNSMLENMLNQFGA